MIRLLGDRLLVKMDPMRTVSDGGILYPNEDAVTEHDIYVWGTVVSTGPGKWAKKKAVRVPVGVSEGDRVLFVRYLAKVETNKSLQSSLSEGHLIIQEQDVLCVEER